MTDPPLKPEQLVPRSAAASSKHSKVQHWVAKSTGPAGQPGGTPSPQGPQMGQTLMHSSISYTADRAGWLHTAAPQPSRAVSSPQFENYSAPPQQEEPRFPPTCHLCLWTPPGQPHPGWTPWLWSKVPFAPQDASHPTCCALPPTAAPVLAGLCYGHQAAGCSP